MELRLKTTLVALTAATLLMAGGCVPNTPTPLPTPTPTPEPTPTPNVSIPCLQDPALSKADPILSQMLARKTHPPETWPDLWREVLQSPTLRIGVRFDHELTSAELEAVSKIGVSFYSQQPFRFLDGTALYEASLTWDKVCPLAKLPNVVAMTTRFNPYIRLMAVE